MGEKGQAVAFFQGMDVLGNGRLGQEELPGGLGEVHGLADTEKGAQLGIHHFLHKDILSFYYKP